jgi:hypothetical protein
MTKDLTKLRAEEAEPVIREILKVLGDLSSEFMIGELNIDDARAYYQKVVEDKIMPILHKYNIRTFDLAYIMKAVMQPIDFIKQITIDSIELAEDAAVAHLFGVGHQSEIRVSHIIDAQLKKSTEGNVDNSTVVNKADLE